MNALREFFAPIPLWFVAVFGFVSIVIGAVLCMPNQWAERFFRSWGRFFRK